MTSEGTKCGRCSFSSENKRFLQDYVVPCSGHKYCLAGGHIWELTDNGQTDVLPVPQLTAIFSLNENMFGFDGRCFVSINLRTGKQGKVLSDASLENYTYVHFQQQYDNVFIFCRSDDTHCYSVELESKKKINLRFVAAGVSCVVNRFLCGDQYAYDMYSRKIYPLYQSRQKIIAASSGYQTSVQDQLESQLSDTLSFPYGHIVISNMTLALDDQACSCLKIDPEDQDCLTQLQQHHQLIEYVPPHHRIFVRQTERMDKNEFVCNGGGLTYVCDSQFRVLKKVKSSFPFESLLPLTCSRGNLGLVHGHLYDLSMQEPKLIRQVSGQVTDQELFVVQLESDESSQFTCYYSSEAQSVYRYDNGTKKAERLTTLRFPIDKILCVGKGGQCLVHVKEETAEKQQKSGNSGGGWYVLDLVPKYEENSAQSQVIALLHHVISGALIARTLIGYDESSNQFIDITTNQTFKAHVSLDFFQSARVLYEEIDGRSFSASVSPQLFRLARINIDFKQYKKNHSEITAGKQSIPFIIHPEDRHFCRPMYNRDCYLCAGQFCQYMCDQEYHCLGKTYNQKSALGFNPRNQFFEEQVIRSMDCFYCVIDLTLFRSACDSTQIVAVTSLPFQPVCPQGLFSVENRVFLAHQQALYEYDQVAGDVQMCGRLPPNKGVFTVADRHFIQFEAEGTTCELYEMQIQPQFLSVSEEFTYGTLENTRALQFRHVATLDYPLCSLASQLDVNLCHSLDFSLLAPKNIESTEILALPAFVATLCGSCAQRDKSEFRKEINQLAFEGLCKVRYEDLCWPEKQLIATLSSTCCSEDKNDVKARAERFLAEIAGEKTDLAEDVSLYI